VVAADLAGQAADVLARTAESAGGAVFGDLEGNVVFVPRDWETYLPDTPNDGTIGNIPPDPNNLVDGADNIVWDGANVVYGTAESDVCPTGWVRPFDRADIATRVVIGRDVATAQIFDDAVGQVLYGIEPFERTDLWTEQDSDIAILGNRLLRTRASDTAPRVRSVSLNAATADNALDLMATVDVYKPSRYRCVLRYPRGDVFDAEHFATGVSHELTPSAWTLDLNLDLSAPYIAAGGRWDGAFWDQSLWTTAVAVLDEARAVLAHMEAS
jgi:hypothetical protein